MNAVLHLSTWSIGRLPFRFPASVLADSVNDPESTRKVYLLAGGLALLGVVLIAITVWFWRNTRHDPELLGPLEAMGERKFVRLDARSQQQLLDSVRPPDAEPLRSTDGSVEVEHGEPIDLKVAKSSVAAGYEDLRDKPSGQISESAAKPSLAGDGTDASTPRLAESEPSAAAEGSVAADALAAADGDSPDPAESSDDIATDDDPVARSEDAPSDGAPSEEAPIVDADEPVDSTAETMLDEFAILDAIRRSAPDAASTEQGVKPLPLVIVPMDHDLPAGASAPSSGRTAPAPRHAPEPVVVADVDGSKRDEDSPASPSSIDPLLRRRDHTDD